MSMKKIILASGLSLWALWASAQTTDPLNTFLTQTQAAKGSFHQQTFQKDGKPAEKPQIGNFVFSRPGKFVWTYTEPFEQEMICDGEKIYIWDKDLNQVTVRSAKKSIPQSPASILFGTSSYQRDWNASAPVEKDGLMWVTLKPKKSDSSVNSVTFGFKDNQLKKLTFVGAMGETTHLEISELQTDLKPSDKNFEFKPPKGADVVEIP